MQSGDSMQSGIYARGRGAAAGTLVGRAPQAARGASILGRGRAAQQAARRRACAVRAAARLYASCTWRPGALRSVHRSVHRSARAPWAVRDPLWARFDGSDSTSKLTLQGAGGGGSSRRWPNGGRWGSSHEDGGRAIREEMIRDLSEIRSDGMEMVRGAASADAESSKTRT